jgi:hypothetical protein
MSRVKHSSNNLPITTSKRAFPSISDYLLETIVRLERRLVTDPDKTQQLHSVIEPLQCILPEVEALDSEFTAETLTELRSRVRRSARSRWEAQ